MANEPILKHLRSVTPNFKPTNLLEGRLFININDGLLYYGDAANKPQTLAELPRYTAGNAAEVLQVNATGTNVEWVAPVSPALLSGGEITDVSADPATTLTHTSPTVYTVKAGGGGQAHTNFQELDGLNIPDGSTLVWLTGNHWVWLDQLSALIDNILPAYTGTDANKHLSINAGGTGMEWQALPAVTSRNVTAGLDQGTVFATFNTDAITVADHDVLFYSYNGDTFLYTGARGAPVTGAALTDFAAISSAVTIANATKTQRGIVQLAADADITANPMVEADHAVTPKNLEDALTARVPVKTYVTGDAPVVNAIYYYSGGLWKATATTVVDPATGTHWEEVGGAGHYHIGKTAPTDTLKIWFNTDKMRAYVYMNATVKWVDMSPAVEPPPNVIVSDPAADQTINSVGGPWKLTTDGVIEAPNLKAIGTASSIILNDNTADKIVLHTNGDGGFAGDVTAKTLKSTDTAAGVQITNHDGTFTVDEKGAIEGLSLKATTTLEAGGGKFTVDKDGHVGIGLAPIAERGIYLKLAPALAGGGDGALIDWDCANVTGGSHSIWANLRNPSGDNDIALEARIIGGTGGTFLECYDKDTNKAVMNIKRDGSGYFAKTVSDQTGNVRAGRKNLIINGGFDIWQRSTDATGNGYIAVDRFITASTYRFRREENTNPNSPSRYMLTVTPEATGYALVSQRIEDVRTANDQDVTFSVWIKGTAGQKIRFACFQNFGAGGDANVVPIDDPNQWTLPDSGWNYLSVTFKMPNTKGKNIGAGSHTQIGFGPATGAVTDVSYTNAQLEVGKEPTDFEWHHVGEELALCRRYYHKLERETTDGFIVTFGQAQSATISRIVIPHVPNLRAKPTLIVKDQTTLGITNATGNGTPCSKIDGLLLNPMTSTLELTSNPNMVAGNATQASLAMNGWIAFDAEI